MDSRSQVWSSAEIVSCQESDSDVTHLADVEAATLCLGISLRARVGALLVVVEQGTCLQARNAKNARGNEWLLTGTTAD